MLSFRHDKNVDKMYAISNILGVRVEILPSENQDWYRNVKNAKLMTILKGIAQWNHAVSAK